MQHVHNKRKYYYTGTYGSNIKNLHALPVYVYKFLFLFLSSIFLFDLHLSDRERKIIYIIYLSFF